MRTRCFTIESHLLDQHDRRVLQTWSGQEIGTHGDVVVELTKPQAEDLEVLLLILGK